MKLYALIGFPLTHSFSKKYFTEKFLQLGIKDCEYELFSIPTIEELKNVLAQNPFLHGFNVTIPYKKAVLSYLDDISNLPSGLQACNCIKIIDGKLFGYNTDAFAFEQSLKIKLQPHHSHALVLGNGGAATAVMYVLNKLKIKYKVVGRQINDGINFTYSDINKKIITENLLIINTTPLGTFPNVNECANLPYQFITEQHFLYDLVYNPFKTLFLQKGEQQGATIKNGYDMLVMQAEESWRIWNETI